MLIRVDGRLALFAMLFDDIDMFSNYILNVFFTIHCKQYSSISNRSDLSMFVLDALSVRFWVLLHCFFSNTTNSQTASEMGFKTCWA